MPIVNGLATGIYAAQGDVQDIFGISNIASWSQLSPTVTQGTADVNRIQRALDFADATIVSLFRNYGNYATPLAPQGTDASLVCRWAATLAGIWLYDSRGQRDASPDGHRYQAMRESTLAEMAKYRAIDRLNATRRWPAPDAPAAG